MKHFFDEYKSSFNAVFKEYKALLITLALVCALSYGFTITHHSIGIDNTAYHLYFTDGAVLAQGRMTAYLLDKIFGVYSYSPFWSNALAVIVLYFAALVWCVLFKRIGKDKITQSVLIVFSALMVSYPIINEQFIYNPITQPISYLLCGISLMFVYEIFKSKKFLLSYIPIILMLFVVSLNESFASVFLCGIFFILILEYVVKKDKPLKFMHYLRFFILAVIILTLAVTLEFLISYIVIKTANISAISGADNAILWRYNPFFYTLKTLAIGIIFRYFQASSWYLPIAIFSIGCALTIIISVVLAIKRKRPIILLLAFGLLLSVISLSLIKGHVAPYRTCSTFGPFIAFIFMTIMLLLKRKWINVIYGVLMIVLIINQTRVLSGWFVNDYNRYEKDKEIALNVANTIEYEFDESKPLVFVGDVAKAPNVKKVSINGKPFLGWGINGGHPPGGEILIFLELHGHKFKMPTPHQILDAKEIAKDLPKYPKQGYAFESDDFIVVNFGLNDKWELSSKEKIAFIKLKKILIKLTGLSDDYIEGQIYTAIKT